MNTVYAVRPTMEKSSRQQMPRSTSHIRSSSRRCRRICSAPDKSKQRRQPKRKSRNPQQQEHGKNFDEHERNERDADLLKRLVRDPRRGKVDDAYRRRNRPQDEADHDDHAGLQRVKSRSEERRVGKEWSYDST